jgi:hypothetical protein
MQRNMGTLDRVLRLAAGAIILGFYGALDPPLRYVTLLGLIPVGTALTGRCPLYAALGIRTCPAPPPGNDDG